MMTREARQEAKGPTARRERETKKATGGETWLRADWAEASKLQRPLPDGALQIVAQGPRQDTA